MPPRQRVLASARSGWGRKSLAVASRYRLPGAFLCVVKLSKNVDFPPETSISAGRPTHLIHHYRYMYALAAACESLGQLRSRCAPNDRHIAAPRNTVSHSMLTNTQQLTGNPPYSLLPYFDEFDVVGPGHSRGARTGAGAVRRRWPARRNSDPTAYEFGAGVRVTAGTVRSALRLSILICRCAYPVSVAGRRLERLWPTAIQSPIRRKQSETCAG
jgi:hypothetical protein